MQKRIRRRFRLLTAASLVLGFLTLATGYLGFFWQLPVPEEAPPGEILPLPTQLVETTQSTTETTSPAESVPDSEQAAPENTPDTIPQASEATISGEMVPDQPNQDSDQNAESGNTSDAQGRETDELQMDPPTEAVSALPQEDSVPAASEETLPTQTVPAKTEPQPTLSPIAPSPVPSPIRPFQMILRIVCCILLAAELVVLLLLITLWRNVQRHERKGERKFPLTRVSPIPTTWQQREQPLYPIPGVSLGKLHDIGRRDYQQDSFGHTPVLKDTGLLTVLADGMGGLSGGERVSQKIVMEALNYGVAMTPNQLPNALPEMVSNVNAAVNQMLGPQGLYTSGSTLVAALIARQQLWWISVGDSRVYLYREGQINQLSRDHDLLQEWMGQILEGRRSMVEAQNDPESRKLTSFIGMGKLRYVDRCHTPIPLLPGDRVLLMSDGIYGTISDLELQTILADNSNVQEAASRIGQRIREVASPYQDNYTLVILGYDVSDEPKDRGQCV